MHTISMSVEGGYIKVENVTLGKDSLESNKRVSWAI